MRFIKDAFMGKSICIAICTHNRRDLLMNALDAVSKLYVEDYYNVRVLIVENETTPKLEKELSELKFPFQLDYHHEEKIGLAHARNRVFDEATYMGADWVCCFDDDDEPHVDWLVRFEQAASEIPECNVFMGYMKSCFPDNYSPFLQKTVDENLELGSLPPIFRTGNLMVHKSIIKLGEFGYRFDEKFNFSGAEDTNIFKRIYDDNHRICHVPAAIVYDFMHGDRAKYYTVFKRNRRNLVNNYLLLGNYQSSAKIIVKALKELNDFIMFGALDLTNCILSAFHRPKKAKLYLGNIGFRFARLLGVVDYYTNNRPTSYKYK